MADELEPVTQEFEADFGPYIEPMEEASDETEAFADIVEQATGNLSGLRDAGAETGESLADLGAAADDADASLDGLSASEDDATASTETFAESVARMRDEVYETYPGIDEQAASLLAEAAAADAAGISNDQYAASLDGMSAQGDSLAALAQVADLLGAAGLGESITVAKYAMGRFFIDSSDMATDLDKELGDVARQARVSAEGIRLAGIEGSEAFIGAGAAIDDYRARLHTLATDLRDVDSDAKRVAQDLAGIVTGEGYGGGGGGITGLIEKAFGASGGLSGALGSVGSAGAGMLVIAPLIAGIVTGLTGLVSGLGASVIGIGSLVALAYPGFEKIKGAIDDTRKELDKLTPAEHGAVLGIREIKSEYEDMAKAFEPDVFKVLDQGLKVARDILPGLKLPAETTAGVISGLFSQLDKMLSPKYQEILTGTGQYARMKDVLVSDPLKSFDQTIDPYIKTALPAFAQGLGRVGDAFKTLLTTMSPKDVGDDIRDFFGVVAFSLDKVAELVEHTMVMWDDLHRAFDNTRQWVGDARADFQSLETFGEMAWNSLVTTVLHEVVRLTRDTGAAFAELGHATEAYWDDIARDVTGAARQLADETIADWDLLVVSTVRDWHDVANAVSDAIDVVRETVVTAGHYIAATWDATGRDIESIWDGTWSRVVSFAEGIPGRLEGVFAGAGHWLWPAGINLVEGLIGGVRSEVGNLIGSVENMASSALSAAEHALGLGSPSRITRQHGLWLMEGYGEGITEGRGLVDSALRSALGGLPGLFPGSAGGSSPAPSVHVTVPLTLTPGTQGFNDPAFLQYLQREVQEAVLRYGLLNPTNGLSKITPGVRAA